MLSGLKEMRLRQNLRQADLERLTKIPQPRLSRLERGLQQPTGEETGKLLKAFGLNDPVTERLHDGQNT